MRRRADTTSDSLELLLDTITNAFGGILFLAILIVLLVNQNAAQVETVSDTRPADEILHEQTQLSGLNSQIELLESSIKEQEKTLGNLTFNDQQLDYEEVVSLQQQVSALEAKHADLLNQNRLLIEDADKSRQHQANLQLQVNENEAKKASLEDELARLKLPQVRTAKTPRLRRTYKKEFPVLVRYGRLYIPYKLDKSIGTKSFNEEDFILINDGVDLTQVTPRPYRGAAIDESEEFVGPLRNALNNLEKDDFYIAIAIWSDSFVEFNELRNRIVTEGFEYRIIPVEQGGFIQEGSIDEAMIQ